MFLRSARHLLSQSGRGLAASTFVAGTLTAAGASIALCEEKPAVCPVKHGAGAATPVPSIPVAPAAGTGAPAAGVCPIRHAPPAPAAAAAPAAVCPVKHGKGDAAKPAAAGGAVVAIESVSEAVEGARPSATDTSVGSHQRPYGPPDSADRFVHPFERAAAAAARDKQDFPGIEDPSLVLGGRIPATGRGNSEDGSEWVMPSVGQLVRALRRNQKDVEEGDATSVAFVHGVVVGETWNKIREYEALHASECAEPRLSTFEGKYGEHTVKSWITEKLTGRIPFDRHDWVVDRCGKHVRYIIDYYEEEDEEGNQVYSLDCRPAPTAAGMWDRARMSWIRYRKGEFEW